MKHGMLFVGLLLLSFTSYCQKADTLIKKLVGLSLKTDIAGGQVNNTNPKAYNESTKLTPSTYFILLASYLKQSFTKPLHMTGKDNCGHFMPGIVYKL